MRWQTGLAKLAALLLGIAGTACAHAPPSSPRGAIYLNAPPLNQTVESRIKPQVRRLVDELLADGRDMRLDAIPVFSGSDRFLPGKIAIAIADLISATPENDPDRAVLLRGFRQLSQLTLSDPNETWGVYYYMSAIRRLRDAGLLDAALAPETLAALREKLDWRRFVRPDFSLIDLPNNYYGVAYSVARLRFLMGWEDASGSDALLARALAHFPEFSGQFGFADETNGDGRFDRYSVLLSGELAQRFIETGVDAPPEVLDWLRNSVDLLESRFNLRGEGFEYGRSIGAYGESAFLEVFSAAAVLGVLKPEEREMAYAFCARVATRYADYWLDSQTGSVNLWDKGRRTDDYRGKHRILGENLSLGHQYLYTTALWNSLGFADRQPHPGFGSWLEHLPRATTTWFARGTYDRLLVTYRDGDRVIGLPLINGASGQHMHNAYFPIPFSPGVLEGAPDSTSPQLIPRVTLADGAQLMPLDYFTHAVVTYSGRDVTLAYGQSQADRLGADAPISDPRIGFETRYTISPGRITRADRVTASAGAEVTQIDMAFATFSSEATTAANIISFAEGEVARFRFSGMACNATALAGDNPLYQSPIGAFRTLISCRAGTAPADLSWTIEFR